METHGIRTRYRRDLGPAAPKWDAYVGEYDEAVQKTCDESDYDDYPDKSPHMAWADTEEAALIELANNRKIPNWQNIPVSNTHTKTK